MFLLAELCERSYMTHVHCRLLLCDFSFFRRLLLSFVFFFFQAEDGIRDLIVTGVQTCALPISIGLFGVISYIVSQRTHEIGVRVALGAQRTDVLNLIIRHGLLLTVIGLVIDRKSVV